VVVTSLLPPQTTQQQHKEKNMKKAVVGKRQQIVDFPISFLATEFQNGGRSAKDTLVAFFGITQFDISAKNTFRALELSLEIFAEADPDEEWGRIQYGDHPWQSVNVKDKWEFLKKYITPSIEKMRLIVEQYDQITKTDDHTVA